MSKSLNEVGTGWEMRMIGFFTSYDTVSSKVRLEILLP